MKSTITANTAWDCPAEKILHERWGHTDGAAIFFALRAAPDFLLALALRAEGRDTRFPPLLALERCLEGRTQTGENRLRLESSWRGDGVKGFNPLRGPLSELTCRPCACLWGGRPCVCAPGCRSWSSPAFLERAHTGGPGGRSGHRTGSASKLRGGKYNKYAH